MNENIQIENAKSWFVLAQITIILAGFFFAASGIMWSAATSNLNSGVNLATDLTNKDCNQLNNSYYKNFTSKALNYYGEATITNLKLFIDYTWIGVLLITLSLFFWIRGKYLLSKSKNN